jgi:predicted nucleic acid-binding protein
VLDILRTLGDVSVPRSDWFLTDDAAAREFARSAGLEVHGSLGVVLLAADRGDIARAEAENALDRLERSSLWVSSRVLARARRVLRGME